MALDAESERKKVEDAIRGLDYVRFTYSDLNGVARGKLIPAEEAPRFLDGLPHFLGMIAMGCRGEIPEKTLEEVAGMGHPNFHLMPDFSTFHILPWSGGGKYKVGELLTIYHDPKTNVPYEVCPRQVALEQIRKLGDLGYSLLSGWEAEFNLYKKGTKQPAYEGLNAFHCASLAQVDPVVMDFEKNLREIGVPIEAIHAEYHPGQIEMATRPQHGIKAADGAFLMKAALHEMAYQKGYDANFMSKPDYIGCGSGFHFNHSLWAKDSGENAHYDENGKDNITDETRYWVGGLLAHIGALSALSSPTINCYRRFHNPWSPGKASWGIDDRMASIRVKNTGASGSYVENRLPSGVCNPYLVVAGTLAAGIDGLINKIEPPPCGVSENTPDVPHSLQEAIAALRADKVMASALGEKFIYWFTTMKEEVDIAKLGHHDVKSDVESELDAEFEQYSQLL